MPPENLESRVSRVEEAIEDIDGRLQTMASNIDRRMDSMADAFDSRLVGITRAVETLHRDMTEARSVSWPLIVSVIAIALTTIGVLGGGLTTLGVMALKPIEQSLSVLDQQSDERTKNLRQTLVDDREHWMQLREAQFDKVDRLQREDRGRIIDLEEQTRTHFERIAAESARHAEQLRGLEHDVRALETSNQ